MAKYSHLPIYRETWLLMKDIYGATEQFQKSYKYSLGEEIQARTWNLLDLIVEANSKEGKEEILEELSLQFDKLKLRLRFAFEVDQIPEGRFTEIQKRIQEIGKMIGGWLDWSANSD